MSEIKVGDRISWPAPIFPGPTAHPTEREYGTVQNINPTLAGGICYSVLLEADPDGWMIVSPSMVRKEAAND